MFMRIKGDYIWRKIEGIDCENTTPPSYTYSVALHELYRFRIRVQPNAQSLERWSRF